MSFRTTIVLLILLVAGGVTAYLLSGKSADDTARVEPKPAATLQYVFDPQPKESDLTKVSIERAGKPPLAFERSPKPDKPDEMDDWRMTAPSAGAIEAWQLTGTVSTLASLQFRTSFEPGAKDGVSAADAGLEPPQYVVALTDKAGKEYKLEVGKQAALSNDTYVRRAGQKPILVASRELGTQLKKEPGEFRSKRLVALNANDARRLTIEHDGKTWQFSRGDDGEWVIDAPTRAFANTANVKTLLSKLAALRCEDFVEPDAQLGSAFEPALLKLTVTTETKKPRPAPATQESQPAEPQFDVSTATYALEIGAPADMQNQKRYARAGADAPVARIKQSDVDPLIPKMAELRDARITRIKEKDVSAIEINAAGGQLSVTRVAGQWQSADGATGLETSAVTELLQALEDLKAIDYVETPGTPDQYGLDVPRATIKLTTAGQVEPLVLRVGKATESGRNAYVQREGTPYVCVVTSQQADRLVVGPLALRSRSIFAFSPQEITRLDIVRTGAAYKLSKVDGAWRLTEPAGAPLHPNTINTVVVDLARLKARAVAGSGEFEKYGLAQPDAVLSFDVTPASQPATQSAPAEPPAAAQSHTIRVGRAGDKPYCRKDDEPTVYELDETIYRLITTELLERGLFTFKGADVAGFKAAAPAGTVEFVKQDGKWKYVPDPFVALSDKKLNEFMDELAKLQVESYVAWKDGNFQAEELDKAPATIVLTLKDGKTITMRLAQEAPGQLPRKAGIVEDGRIFRLRQTDCEKLLRGLDFYVKTEGSEKPAAPGQPPPGIPNFPPPDDGG